MIAETSEASRICLDGDWSMNGIAEKFPILANYLACVLGSDDSVELQKSTLFFPEIDLAEISDFDACGCQLLALFIRIMKQNGFSIQLSNISDALRNKIYFLGFGRELNLPL